jgi:hypothetical protein
MLATLMLREDRTAYTDGTGNIYCDECVLEGDNDDGYVTRVDPQDVLYGTPMCASCGETMESYFHLQMEGIQ